MLDEFLAADTIVIGAPMYNFTLPSQLKAWIDRIVIAGKTFRYTENGPEGLAGGKRVIIALARGGFYSDGSPAAALEHLETYLRGVFNFIGIEPEFVARRRARHQPRAARAIASSRRSAKRSGSPPDCPRRPSTHLRRRKRAPDASSPPERRGSFMKRRRGLQALSRKERVMTELSEKQRDHLDERPVRLPQGAQGAAQQRQPRAQRDRAVQPGRRRQRRRARCGVEADQAGRRQAWRRGQREELARARQEISRTRASSG